VLGALQLRRVPPTGVCSAEEALVYASFGAGRLLFDFLFLRDLLAEGRTLRRICVMDTLYDECDDEREAARYEDHQVRRTQRTPQPLHH
jgi:hypothetical protein